MNTLAEAMWWHARDVACVPQVYGSKIPSVKWRNLAFNSPTQAQLRMWFRAGLRNLGVILPAGWIVLDFDEAPAYVRWKREHPIESMTVRTRRGWHVYVHATVEAADTFYLEGGDVKLPGETVTVPPSVVAGHRYRYICDRSVTEICDICDLGVERMWGAPPPYAPQLSGNTYPRDGIRPDLVETLSRWTRLRKRSDGTYIGVCPFHDDSRPSLHVFPGEGRFYCYAPHCVAHRRCDVWDAFEFRNRGNL